MYLGIYISMFVTTIKEKGALYLKESKDVYVGRFGGREGRNNATIISKNNNQKC